MKRSIKPNSEYDRVLSRARKLPASEKRRLISELSSEVGAADEPLHSIFELRGLGKEIWEGIDAQEYVKTERESWER